MGQLLDLGMVSTETGKNKIYTQSTPLGRLQARGMVEGTPGNDLEHRLVAQVGLSAALAPRDVAKAVAPWPRRQGAYWGIPSPGRPW